MIDCDRERTGTGVAGALEIGQLDRLRSVLGSLGVLLEWVLGAVAGVPALEGIFSCTLGRRGHKLIVLLECELGGEGVVFRVRACAMPD
jgi:hypothetical protein